MLNILLISLAGLAGVIVAITLMRVVRRLQNRVAFEQARKQFHKQRERLEAKLVRQIAVPAVAGELEWMDCEFDDEILFLREKKGRGLAAVVAVTLGTESEWLTPASEEPYRCGVAIFRFQNEKWDVDPKIYMNLGLDDVVRELSRTMEVLCRERSPRG